MTACVDYPIISILVRQITLSKGNIMLFQEIKLPQLDTNCLYFHKLVVANDEIKVELHCNIESIEYLYKMLVMVNANMDNAVIFNVNGSAKNKHMLSRAKVKNKQLNDFVKSWCKTSKQFKLGINGLKSAIAYELSYIEKEISKM